MKESVATLNGLLNPQLIFDPHTFNHIAKVLEATNAIPTFLSALH